MSLKSVLGFASLFFTFTAFAAPIKVALILDRGGKDDKSFNAAAYRGATEAKNKLGIQLKDVEPADESQFESAIRATAQKKFDLIIGVGFSQKEAISKVAKEFPNQKFALVDAISDQSNVRNLMFSEHEGSYLVGAIAAMKSKSGTIGFVGGMDIPLIRRFVTAYEQGAKATNPKIKVLVNYVGVTGEAWNNPTKGKELALTQISQGADIIFQASGNSGVGVFDATEKQGKLAIGCDSNQNYIKPGKILTSMVKKVDEAVFKAIEDANNNHFSGGTVTFGLKDKGIDWALDQHNQSMFTKAEIEKIDSIKNQIIKGQIKVRDYYKNPR